MAPTDEELLELMPQWFRDDLALVSRMASHGAGPEVQPGLFRVTLNTGALDYARAVWDRARAALAQPEPEVVGPSVEELDDLFNEIDQSGEPLSWRAYARAVLSRWGRPAPVPAGEVAYAASIRRMCDIILGNTFGNEELDSLALLVGHHPDVLNASPAPAGEVGELVAWLRAWARGTLEEGQPATSRSLTRAADLLEQRHPAPVPVAERLPGLEDCDAEHYCWRWNTIGRLWARQPLARSWYEFESHWLPAHALPLPSGEVG